MRLLFICTGNICRSPTAERLTTAFAAQAGIADLSARSAGTRPVIGHPMEPTAARVLESLGGDPAGFVARRLTSDIAYDADLVIAMTEQHRAAVLNLAPAQLRHTFTLREAARLTEQSGATSIADLEAARPHFPAHGPEDISDPIGQDEQTFLTIGTEIADLLLPMLGRVRS